MSERQTEVLKLIADGFTNKEIAKKLYLSIETVRTHRKDLIERYGARNSVNLVKLWLTS
jgi:DNA-binding NarL/FixJ family response regulator